MQKVKIFTEYVDNVFNEIENSFKEVYKHRNIKQEFVDNPFSIYFILFINDRIIGFLHINKLYEKMEIVNINILKDYQGKGYSKILMDELIRFSNKEAIENITLEVKKDNYKAISLYKKYNFKEVAVRKNYYNGIDGILMERK